MRQDEVINVMWIYIFAYHGVRNDIIDLHEMIY